MNDSKFGNYILELRSRAGLTQSELAAEVGVTNKAVSEWETGRRDDPKARGAVSGQRR